MKRIINGKKYDTDTARQLAGWSNEIPMGDYNHMGQYLYQKKNGEFFVEINATDGDDINPLSENEAMAWVERFANDAYEKLFGEVSE